jgi:hypothetical protein
VAWRGIMEPHWKQTQKWMSAHSVVLCLQDTTELDFNGQEAEGLGPLNYEARRGMYVHPTYAVTPQREPLGILDAWMWAREDRDKDGVRHGQKESTRWIEGYERVAEMAAEMPATRLVGIPVHRDHPFRSIVTDFRPPPESAVTMPESAVTIPEWRRTAQ